MDGGPERTEAERIDTDAITSAVETYPVVCALVYGSRVGGTATKGSDVDIAVGFEEDIPATERLEHRIELTTELAKTLGTDDIDVADLDTVRPAVGLSALDTGIVLLGDEETLARYRERFEREGDEETHEERMRRFDGVLDRLEGRV